MAVYCYLLECVNGSYYCGWAKDLHRRVAMHQKGKGARYTRMNAPVKLVYFEELADPTAALKREREIKKMTHVQKMTLAAGFGKENLLSTSR